MLGLIGKPVLLELHPADIGQRRMQPSSVKPKQPSNGLILGRTPSLEPLPVQPFHLQRSNQGLAASVMSELSHRRRWTYLKYQRAETYKLISKPKRKLIADGVCHVINFVLKKGIVTPTDANGEFFVPNSCWLIGARM